MAGDTDKIEKLDEQKNTTAIPKDIFVIFIDICGSTSIKSFGREQSKEPVPTKWLENTQYFYKLCYERVKKFNKKLSDDLKQEVEENEEELSNIKLQILKYVGDEAILILDYAGTDNESIKSKIAVSLLFFAEEFYASWEKKWKEATIFTRLKIALHCGNAFKINIQGILPENDEPRDTSDYLGTPLDTCARLENLAEGGCTLASDKFIRIIDKNHRSKIQKGYEVHDWAGEKKQVWLDVGIHPLKGLGYEKIWVLEDSLPKPLDGSMVRENSIIFKALKIKNQP